MRAPDLHRSTGCTCLIDLPPELLTAICGLVECRAVVRCRSVARLAFFFVCHRLRRSRLGMQAIKRNHRYLARTPIPHRTRSRWHDRWSFPNATHDRRPTSTSPSTTTCVEDAELDAVRDSVDARTVLCVRARGRGVLQDAAWAGRTFGLVERARGCGCECGRGGRGGGGGEPCLWLAVVVCDVAS